MNDILLNLKEFYNLSKTEYKVLEFIILNKIVSSNDLFNELNIKKSNLNIILNNLLKKNIILKKQYNLKKGYQFIYIFNIINLDNKLDEYKKYINNLKDILKNE